MWHPDATRTVYDRWSTSRFPSPDRRAVWHTTEGDDNVTDWYPQSGAIPHFTILTSGELLQHYDTDYHARALANKPGGVETNRAGAIQIEIVGHAGRHHTPAQLAVITSLTRWLTEAVGVAPICPAGRMSAPYHRSSVSLWVSAGGHWAHAQVPEQSGRTDPDMTGQTWTAFLAGTLAAAPALSLSASAPSSESTFGVGDSGDDVADWQRVANLLGAGLVVDGQFGPLTAAATRAVERRFGLPADGRVGPDQSAAVGLLARVCGLLDA